MSSDFLWDIYQLATPALPLIQKSLIPEMLNMVAFQAT